MPTNPTTPQKTTSKARELYPTPPLTRHRVSGQFTSPLDTCLLTPERTPRDHNLPDVVHEATVPDAPYFSPRTRFLELPPSPSPAGRKLPGDTGTVYSEEGAYWDEMARMAGETEPRTNDHPPIALRPVMGSGEAWWLVAQPNRLQTPLFVDYEEEGESELDPVDMEEDTPGGGRYNEPQNETEQRMMSRSPTAVGVFNASRLSLGTEYSAQSQPLALVSSSDTSLVVRDTQMIAHQPSRRRTRAESEDDEMTSDVEYIGATIAPKRIKMEYNEPIDFSREDTPLEEVWACGACGCACGGNAAARPTSTPDPVDGGKRTMWSAKISKRSLGLILEELIGGPSLRARLGSQVSSWADVAQRVGVDRGAHDTVRAVAKRMQERLPEMMRRGQI